MVEQYINRIEAIVFVAGKAVEIKDIADKLGLKPAEVKKAAEMLGEKYSGECGIHFLTVNNKLQFCSNPDYAGAVEEVLSPIRERELSRAMLEVAAIIAYRQPITRLEIEELRGVNSDYSIGMLLKNSLVEVVGRKDAIGKPLLFGTTDEFLKRFKLSELDELPDYDELLERIRILHQPASADLFYKEEYKGEDGENGDAQAGQVEGQLGIALDEAAAAAEPPAEEKEKHGTDGGGGQSAQTQPQPVEQAEQAVSAGRQAAPPKEQNFGEEAEHDDFSDELPDFLAGETDLQRIE